MAIGEKSNVQKAQEAVLGDGFGPDIKFIQRDLATRNPSTLQGVSYAWEVEEYIRGFLVDGWKLHDVSVATPRREGEANELVYSIFLVLVRELQPAP